VKLRTGVEKERKINGEGRKEGKSKTWSKV